MKTFWKFAPTALASTALVLATVQTVRLSRLKKAAVTTPRAAAKADGDRLAQMEKRIASLERATRRLVGLALTRGGGGGGGGEPDPVLLGWLKSEVKNLRDDVDNVIAGENIATEGGKKKLKDLLKKVRQEDRKERRKRWKQVASHMQRAALNRFAEDARVDPATTERLDTMLTDEREKLRGLWRDFRSGDKDVEGALAEARKLLDQTESQARSLLDESQFTDFQKMRQDMPGMRFLRRMGLRRK